MQVTMRHIIYIELIFLLLTTTVASCTHHAHNRLALADTLMWTNPDSSLAILSHINNDSLTSDEDRAYHALLLTQAQFRCNGNCSSDSLINFALDYYSDNHNREHYTRSLIYKGAYYEFNTNQPVEAIKCYKQAEENADTTDFRNLAQLNMRMGVIYYNNYVGKNFDLLRFKKSLYYYSLLNNASSIMLCHSYIGNIYRFTNQDSARYHLTQALIIAQEIGDSCEVSEIYTSFSKSYLQDNDFKKALLYAKKGMNNCGNSAAKDLCFYNLARAYSGLGMTDSAMFYLSKTSDTHNQQLQDNRYLALRDYYSAIGNHEQFKKFNALYLTLSDSLESNRNIAKLADADNEHRQLYINQNKKDVTLAKRQSAFIIIVIFALALVAFILLLHQYQSKTKLLYSKTDELQRLLKSQNENGKSQINEILSELRESSTQLKNTKENLKETYMQYASLTGLLTAHINVMQILTDASQTQTKDVFYKTFIATVKAYKNNDNLYNNISRYINDHYGNLITDLCKKYPSLNDEEIKIIKLVALGFSYIDVAVLFDKKPNAMSTKFTRIARKIGANESLAKHINRLKKERRKSSSLNSL